jgi:hypothetical protein
MQPDGDISLTYRPTGPTSMRVKRHRLYPQETLARPDLVERHAEETAAVRTFVGQDGYAFALVQHGLSSWFAPRGPVANREQVLTGFNRWLVDRYRATEQADAVAV